MSILVLSKQIESLFEEMKELTLKADVPYKLYSKVIHVDDNITEQELQERLTFLQDVRADEYAKLLYTWLLVPEEVWQNYVLFFGIEDFDEQKALRKCQKNLRKKWREKYGKKKNVIDNNSEGSDGDPVQSERDGSV